MAAAALLRSAASKMLSRASDAAAPTLHHRSLVARGLHGGGARSRPATDVIQIWCRGLHSRTSPADVIPSTPQPKVFQTTARAKLRAGVAYATLFGACIFLQFWVKPAQEEARAQFQTLCKQRSDLMLITDSQQNIIQTQREIIAMLLNDKHVSSVSHQTPSTVASGHVNPLGNEEALNTAHSQENLVKQIEDLRAEIADHKIALDRARSQAKF